MVETRALTRRFDDCLAVDGLTLDVGAGPKVFAFDREPSTRVWERIPGDQRAALQSAARRATASAQAEVRRFEAEAIRAMQRYGLTVHPVAPADAARFEREIRDSYPKLVGPSIPAPIFAKASAYLDEFRRR